MRPSLESDFAGTARFEVLRRLGQGGMGVVYEAFDRERHSRVALKTLTDVSADTLLRFKNEFRGYQDLQHPNLVNLGELFFEEGRWFFTMELLQGRNFADYVAGLPFTEEASKGSERAETTTQVSPRVGDDRVGWQGGPARYDETRLRPALRQLVRGLVALHDSGSVHRDVKPSNVLVTRDERVVVLDYGLASALDDRGVELESSLIGTILYMAPEQAAGKRVGPEADWYSLGVMLFEVLTGSSPFVGRATEVLADKQRRDGPAPSSLSPGVPADLDALCAELLRVDPSRRPTGRQVLQRLGERSAPADAGPSLPSDGAASLYVGRAAELAALHRALAEAGGGASVLVYVRGESGVGKSALVKRFLADAARLPNHWVLGGVCYEREFVPYKGLDGVIDSLSRALARLSRTEARRLVPPDVGILTRAFPVLSRVEAFAEARFATSAVEDPKERRSRLLRALWELFSNLSRHYVLVLHIDDYQWSDADSMTLLGELLRPPRAPPVLTLLTVRTEVGDRRTGLELFPALQAAQTRDVALERLAPAESQALAEQLLRRLGQDPAAAAAIAREAAGHPLFIDELVRQGGREAAPAAAVPLEEVLWRRLTQLESPARCLVELASLSGGRISQQDLARAADLEPAKFSRLVGLLRAAHLLRTHGARMSDAIEPYHGRVRAAVHAHLPAQTAALHHRRLALALEVNGDADPEALAGHWQAAGQPESAAHYARLAARRADDALAFDQAARFYRLCLTLAGQAGPAPRLELNRHLGEALGNAGRGLEAAEAFLAAAEAGSAVEQLELRRLAADQLLRSGHVDRGTQTLKEVLSAVGVRMAGSSQGALAGLLWQRARVGTRGIRFKEQPTSKLSAEQLLRLDATWTAATGLSMVDPILGAAFQAKNLLLSLSAGEPYRVSRAIAMEAAFLATSGVSNAARAEALLARASALAERLDHPHALGLSTLVRGVLAFECGRWREAHVELVHAERLFRERCRGVAWELASACLFRLAAAFYLGELSEMSAALPALRREADGRSDLYLSTHLSLNPYHIVWLAQDDPKRVHAQAEEALARWPLDRYSLQHWYRLASRATAELYEGDAEGARRRVMAEWGRLKSSMLLRVQLVRVESTHLRGRVGLACGRAHVADALRCARSLVDEKVPYAAALGQLLFAGAEAVQGNSAGAAKLFADAVATCDAADMRLYSAAAQYRRSVLEGGAEGSAQGEPPLAWLKARGVAAPEKLVSMLVPV